MQYECMLGKSVKSWNIDNLGNNRITVLNGNRAIILFELWVGLEEFLRSGQTVFCAREADDFSIHACR